MRAGDRPPTEAECRLIVRKQNLPALIDLLQRARTEARTDAALEAYLDGAARLLNVIRKQRSPEQEVALTKRLVADVNAPRPFDQ